LQNSSERRTVPAPRAAVFSERAVSPRYRLLHGAAVAGVTTVDGRLTAGDRPFRVMQRDRAAGEIPGNEP
jgi:hypothetical protein